jgi:hypothetical protein
MDDARSRKVAFGVSFVNAMLVLFWLLFNLHEERKAAMPIVPTNNAGVVFALPSQGA